MAEHRLSPFRWVIVRGFHGLRGDGGLRPYPSLKPASDAPLAVASVHVSCSRTRKDDATVSSPRVIKFSSLLTAALVAAALLVGHPATAHAASSTELQAQLDAALVKVEDLRQQTSAAFDQLESLQGQVEDTKAQIAETESKIQETQAELTDARGTLAERVSANYKTGGVSFVEILLGSTSFEDFVSRIGYANRFAESDAEFIDRVKTLEAQLNESKGALELQQQQQEELVDQAQAKATQVQASQQEYEAYVDSLSAEVQEALKKEEEERRAEEQRKAEEAAAAAAAQQAAEASSSASSNGGGSPSSSGGSSAGSSSSGSASSGGSGSSSGGSGSSGSSSGSGSSSSGGSSSGSSAGYGSGISAVIAAAKSQLGVSYSYSGSAIANQEFDCSGLVWWAYQQGGYSIPRGQRMSNGRGNSMIGWVLDRGGWTTNQANLKAGDLMFWGSGVNSTTHVGICIGNGQMIHSNYGGVEITSVYYSSGSFVGGGPIV